MGLFLIPARTENLNVTIKHAVKLEKVYQYFPQKDIENLEKLQLESPLRCWAMTEGSRSYYNKMQVDDIVLFTEKKTGKFQYKGKISYKVKSQKPPDCLWPFIPNQPWELIYFLKDIKQININKSLLLKELGYVPNFSVRGTIRVKESRVKIVKEKYGSIENFIQHLTM